MWLYLFAQQMPPCRYGGTMVPLIAPWPGASTLPAVVKLYQDSDWRREDVSLLEFCRKSNRDGGIARWVIRLHKDDEETRSRNLRAFANTCLMFGEKLMACDMLSIFNDRWFGQWLALRKPFRDLADLVLSNVQEKVPVQFHHFANAAMGSDKIETFLAKLRAQRTLVDRFLSGSLAKEDDAGAQEAMREVGLLAGEEDPMFRDVRFNKAGAFFLYKDAVEVMDCLTQYDMIAVDEVSQLSKDDFERIVQMWEAADKLPVLVFAGDFWQLPGVQPTRATDSPKWRSVRQVKLHEMWRCKDETLRAKLEPTAWDLQELCRKVPHTTIATCTRRAAALVNDLSIWVLFTTKKRRQLADLFVDWESNVENFDEDNKVITGKPPGSDFINGMECTVLSFAPTSGCLHILTKTGRNLAVYPITDWITDCGYVTAYPVRAGYASTIHKLQGAELDHITIWLDVPFMKAAGYVALSRVQRDGDYLLGGIVRRRHFMPAM
ncbi:Pif1 [Symbiodinium pilosum]|uniref:Pif1 protein n=1 Tax=Symbiodinium pilosum TaxID=2952 RepID=A0A812TD20_SYMPI|nr:Pif1 [Symbiodinium pilosum]